MSNESFAGARGRAGLEPTWRERSAVLVGRLPLQYLRPDPTESGALEGMAHDTGSVLVVHVMS
jgi:hypothetical protein